MFTPSEEEVCKIVEDFVECNEEKFGLVAVFGDKIIGHSVDRKISEDTAEIGFVVREGFQGKGVATILLGAMAEIAEKNGIKVFESEVLPEKLRHNRRL
ncbi:N-acetyltransferase family protein [Archaeoglobus sp.]